MQQAKRASGSYNKKFPCSDDEMDAVFNSNE